MTASTSTLTLSLVATTCFATSMVKTPQVEEHYPVYDGDDEEYARPLHLLKTAQTKYDHPLIFADDLDRLRQYHQTINRGIRG